MQSEKCGSDAQGVVMENEEISIGQRSHSSNLEFSRTMKLLQCGLQIGPRGLLYILLVRGCGIGKGIDSHNFCMRNGISFCNFGVRNGINFRNFGIRKGTDFSDFGMINGIDAFSENWYNVGYIFSENWYQVRYTFRKNWYKERVCFLKL